VQGRAMWWVPLDHDSDCRDCPDCCWQDRHTNFRQNPPSVCLRLFVSVCFAENSCLSCQQQSGQSRQSLSWSRGTHHIARPCTHPLPPSSPRACTASPQTRSHLPPPQSRPRSEHPARTPTSACVGFVCPTSPHSHSLSCFPPPPLHPYTQTDVRRPPRACTQEARKAPRGHLGKQKQEGGSGFASFNSVGSSTWL